MTQLIYITNHGPGSGVGGREQISRLHSEVLRDLIGDDFASVVLDSSAGAGKLLGYIDGVSRASIESLVTQIIHSGARQVFLDGSNLGRMAEGIKQAVPQVEVLTFFHNCEARFFLGAFRKNLRPHALGVLMANYLAERLAVRHSDKLICLNERDSRQLRRLYGRGATHLSAMALQDRLPPLPEAVTPPVVGCYALFVGGTFYANQAGIAWFAEHVAPRVSVKTYVVGRGFEQHKAQLEQHQNIEVIGAVDDLAPWYLGAQFVIAPIFDGSGMKTKVAEALMYGKRVIGTTEAFTGYEDVAHRIGSICDTSEDFVRAIAGAAGNSHAGMDRNLRLIYEQRYSLHAARGRLAAIIGVPDSRSAAE